MSFEIIIIAMPEGMYANVFAIFYRIIIYTCTIESIFRTRKHGEVHNIGICGRLRHVIIITTFKINIEILVSINYLTDDRKVVKKTTTTTITVHIVELNTYRVDIKFISESYIIDKLILIILHKVKGVNALEIFIITIPHKVISIFILKTVSSGSERGISNLKYYIVFAVGSSIFTLYTEFVTRRDAKLVTAPEEHIDRSFVVFKTADTNNEFTGRNAPVFIELASENSIIGSFEKVGKFGKFIQAITKFIGKILVNIPLKHKIEELTCKGVRVSNAINTADIILPIGSNIKSNIKATIKGICGLSFGRWFDLLLLINNCIQSVENLRVGMYKNF